MAPGSFSSIAEERVPKPPPGDSYYGDKATRYLARRANQAWWHHEHKAVRRLLRKLPKGLTVLDVPFGTGRFIPLYLKRGMEVYGLDASCDMIREAAKVPGFDKCHITIGDARDMPYPDASFDLVVCFRFLEGIVSFGEAKRILSEIARVTRRYAILELDFHTPHRPQQYPPCDAERMARCLSYGEVVSLLSSKGLETQEVVGPLVNNGCYAFLCTKGEG